MGTTTTKGFLLAGPAGSGKTVIANCILSYFKNTLFYSAYSVSAMLLSYSDA